MALLPVFITQNKDLQMMQNLWSSLINPVLKNPLTAPLILKNVQLSTGINVINHLLSRTQQGWVVTDINAAVTLYRSAPFNDKTLTLTSSGSALVTLAVY